MERVLLVVSVIAVLVVQDRVQCWRINNKAYRSISNPTGCPCWWDLAGRIVPKNSCACCVNGGIQCGYPLHENCQGGTNNPNDKKNPGLTGCIGIRNWLFTLSEQGMKCHYDLYDYTCAWCTPRGRQCGIFSPAIGQYCRRMDLDHRECFGRDLDCRSYQGLCDPNAECKDTGFVVVGATASTPEPITRWSCFCKDGFLGNGIDCMNTTSNEIPATGTRMVEVELKQTIDYEIVSQDPQPDIPQTTLTFVSLLEAMAASGQPPCPACTQTPIICGDHS